VFSEDMEILSLSRRKKFILKIQIKTRIFFEIYLFQLLAQTAG
jgi:hypothetical protein